MSQQLYTYFKFILKRFYAFVVAASKAPRKHLRGVSSNSRVSFGEPSTPGLPLINHAKMWPTPKWQKGMF